MEIRDAVTADAESIRRVHRASIEGLGPEAYSETQVEAWARGCESADYAAAIESDSLTYLVAERDGEVVAFGSLSLDTPSEYVANVNAEITGIYVHPETARHGVGTALLEALEDVARSQDVGALGLTASLNAVPFYEHHGYERTKTRTHEFSAHDSTGVVGDVVEMRKSLS